jgi:hypothetical protein
MTTFPIVHLPISFAVWKYEVIDANGATADQASQRMTDKITTYRQQHPNAQVVNISATVCCGLSDAAGGGAVAGTAKNFYLFALVMNY